MKRTLVIGYGNTLRGDDGAGICAAERTAGHFPEVDVVTVHELQPELAESMARYERVVFLDAAMEGSRVRSMAVEAAPVHRLEGSHGHTPEELLALCRSVYGHMLEQALVVAIPGETFDFGEQLSPFTEQMVEQAVEEVGHFILS